MLHPRLRLPQDELGPADADRDRTSWRSKEDQACASIKPNGKLDQIPAQHAALPQRPLSAIFDP